MIRFTGNARACLLRAGILQLGMLVALPLLAGCENVKVPLDFRPSDPNPSSGLLVSALKVYVEPVEDRRINKEWIGQNVEGKKPFPAIAAEKTVPEFVHEVTEQIFTEDGLPLVTAPALADRRVKIVLTNFWVQETGTYHAAVGAFVYVYNKNGTQIWDGTLAGGDSTFGHSRSAENYRQTLSNALMKALASLTADQTFTKALTKP